MRLREIIWKGQTIAKLALKHQISVEEVEEILFGKPHIRRLEKGLVKGEDLYSAYGQTEAGRYVIVFFIKKGAAAMPISAREMTEKEEKYYGKQK